MKDKQAFILLVIVFLLAVITLSCSKDENCGCRHSDTLNRLVPNEFSEDNISENWNSLSDEQRMAIINKCSEDCK